MYIVNVCDYSDGVSVYCTIGNKGNGIDCIKNFSIREQTSGMYEVVYISRLFVSPENRRIGIATMLMTRLIQLADEKAYELEFYINPYGELTYDQLVHFYEKFGFIQEVEGIWVRYPKTQMGG